MASDSHGTSSSAPRKTSPKEGIVKLGAKVKESTSIFENEKLAEDLLNLFLLSRDQKEQWPWSADKVFVDSFSHLHGVSIFQICTLLIPRVLSS